jgi:hypothetical protein
MLMLISHPSPVSLDIGSNSTVVKKVPEEAYVIPPNVAEYSRVVDKIVGRPSCYPTDALVLNLNEDVVPPCSWSIYHIF